MSLSYIFALILVLGTCITGVIWLVDRLAFAPKRRARLEAARKEEGAEAEAETEADNKPADPLLVDYARSFFPVFLIVLIVRAFIVEPFHIPSGSMIPTLLVGDFVLVNKFSYGLRMPLSHWEFVDFGDPQRGDVVVFRPPWQPDQTWIKRIIGLPGDHIVYRNETLYINGNRISDTPLGWYSGPTVAEARVSVEHLGDDDHKILTMPNVPSKEGSWTVPPNEYFVMGDNRDNSEDSRYMGFVPEKAMVGKAFFIWMNWDGFPSMPMWSRIGNAIN
ncbi:MAG TPA: signal peptidase I [Gammaproteobacteria bacterium]|nr:signal peptidase I [Gammaproteobacteria bacterium]